MVKGLAADPAEAIVAARTTPYLSIPDLHRWAAVPVAALERLAEADAFRALDLDRTARGLGYPRPVQSPVAAVRPRGPRGGGWRLANNEPAVSLPAITEGRQVVEDYRSVGLSLRDHPVSFLRATLDQRRITRCADLARRRDGSRLTVRRYRAGPPTPRQRPRRSVRHHRGRDRSRESHCLAIGFRPIPPRFAVRHHAWLPRQTAKGKRRHSCHRGGDHRHVRAAAKRRRRSLRHARRPAISADPPGQARCFRPLSAAATIMSSSRCRVTAASNPGETCVPFADPLPQPRV